ncbi:hypothetical protein ABVT39_027841 [Epinephelus coioides]
MNVAETLRFNGKMTGSSKSVDRDRSTSRTPRSHGQGGSTNCSSRSVDQDRSTSCSSRSVDRDRSTSRTPRSHEQGGSTNKFQKIVTNFVKLHEEIKKLQMSSEPHSASRVERIQSLEEFKEKEASLQDQGHFDTLLGNTSSNYNLVPSDVLQHFQISTTVCLKCQNTGEIDL